MKSLALVLPAMRIGGAEKIALNFIPRLQEHFKVTLVLGKLEGRWSQDACEARIINMSPREKQQSSL